MGISWKSCVPLLAGALLAPAVAGAQSAPEPANAEAGPLDTIQALFDAMEAHDTTAARALIAPGARLLVVRPDGSMHEGSDEGFIESLGKDTEAWLERSWDVQVMVDGPMAQAWGPYDFHRGGTFSHCGTNSVTLVRGEQEWRIVAIAYTMRKDDCPAPADD